MNQSKKMKSSPREVSNTIMLLLSSIGRNIHLETHDGCTREGKLTSFDCRGIIINGEQCDLPMSLELNGDITDHIDIKMIAKLDID